MRTECPTYISFLPQGEIGLMGYANTNSLGDRDLQKTFALTHSSTVEHSSVQIKKKNFFINLP